ncbi:hypothetical protein Mapa_015556 [Marchantia paleacea]|nr:hypothetical protein Mapa_015556 [Marchantia paleacea]
MQNVVPSSLGPLLNLPKTTSTGENSCLKPSHGLSPELPAECQGGTGGPESTMDVPRLGSQNCCMAVKCSGASDDSMHMIGHNAKIQNKGTMPQRCGGIFLIFPCSTVSTSLPHRVSSFVVSAFKDPNCTTFPRLQPLNLVRESSVPDSGDHIPCFQNLVTHRPTIRS